MIRCRCRWYFWLLVSGFLTLAALVPAAAQEAGLQPPSGSGANGPSEGRSLVVLTALYAPPGDAIAQKLASTITGSLELVMKLTGAITVRRADFLAPTFTFGRARSYYEEVNANGAVYGSVSPAAGGGYRIVLGLWNGSRPGAAPELFRRTTTNVLTSFTMADRLAVAVTSSIVGHPLAEGTLVIENTKLLREYAVYADGHLLARNRSTLPVLTGRREIVVAKPGGPLGDVPVEVFHVTIRRGRTTTVSLSAKKIASGAAKGAKLVRSASAGVRTGAGARQAAAAAPAAGSAAAPKRAKQQTWTTLVSTAASGRLFLDGKADGTVTAGETRLITGITAGSHLFAVRYSDGHRDSRTRLFSPDTPQAAIKFTYRPMRYTKAGFFRAQSLSFGSKKYLLTAPGSYSSALGALSALPTVSPAMEAEIANAKSLVGPWRVQRAFHVLWLASFWGIVGYGAFFGTNAGPNAPLIAAAGVLTSTLFLLINAEHRGNTRGELASDVRSIAGSYDRTVGPAGPVGIVLVGAKSAGVLFVDGEQRGSVAAGRKRTVYDVPLGHDVISVRYPDGHVERETLTLTSSSPTTSLYFGYTARG